MRRILYILASIMILFVSYADLAAQVDKKDVRRGNRDFRKENYKEAEIDYLKALVKDSTSVAANYNLASSFFRLGDMEQARKTLDRIKDSAPMTPQAADYFYNLGDVALAQQDYQTAVEAFAQSLIRRPEDLKAKENFIYAREMLKNQQQNQQQNQNQDQNQDQNQNQDQHQEQSQTRDQDQNQNQDQNQDQNQQPKITPQAAQQMLQAIQAKEKETQDKVNREKAAALKSRQKDKNW